MTLCYDAAKPMTYDPFFVSDQLRVHILREDGITDLIDRQCYGASSWRCGATRTRCSRPPGRGFSAIFMTHLFAHYHVVLASHDVATAWPCSCRIRRGAWDAVPCVAGAAGAFVAPPAHSPPIPGTFPPYPDDTAVLSWMRERTVA